MVVLKKVFLRNLFTKNGVYMVYLIISDKFAIILDYTGNESMNNYRACYYKDDIQRLSDIYLLDKKYVIFTKNGWSI